MKWRSLNSLESSNGWLPAPPNGEAPSIVRAVVYARSSSAAQRDRHTIASQLATLPKFVSLRGWKLVRSADTYVDDDRTAKGGFLSKRTSFTRLMHDAGQGLFDVVAVVDLDRLTRPEDLRERGEVLGAFQRGGVQIAVSGTGQVLDLRSSAGDLMSTSPGDRNVLKGLLNWTRIVVHELSHYEVGTADVPGQYAWQGIKPGAGFTPAQAITNAENWAFFAADVAGALTDGKRNEVLV